MLFIDLANCNIFDQIWQYSKQCGITSVCSVNPECFLADTDLTMNI